jgi:hypothetical protein
MEDDAIQDLVAVNMRPSTDLSFRSSQCSLGDIESEDFYELCKNRLKVSKRNIALTLKIT